jgi:hypothetical protein
MRRLAVLALFVAVVWPSRLVAHCDTLSGPVIAAARAALESGDITPVLMWVKPEAENEIRDAFRQASTVRGQSDTARLLADRWFFETLVRLHRAGEGEPFTGIKDEPAAPEVQLADQSIQKGSIDDLASRIAADVAIGVRERFRRVMDAKKNADRNVESGRRYVAAYVDFVHYVEQARGGSDHNPH